MAINKKHISDKIKADYVVKRSDDNYLIDGHKCPDILSIIGKISNNQLMEEDLDRISHFIVANYSVNGGIYKTLGYPKWDMDLVARLIAEGKDNVKTYKGIIDWIVAKNQILPQVYLALGDYASGCRPRLTKDAIIWYNQVIRWLQSNGVLPQSIGKMLGCNKYWYGTYVDIYAVNKNNTKMFLADFDVKTGSGLDKDIESVKISDMVAAAKVQACCRMYREHYNEYMLKNFGISQKKTKNIDLVDPVPEFYKIVYNKYNSEFEIHKPNVVKGWLALKEILIKETLQKKVSSVEDMKNIISKLENEYGRK